MIDIKQNEFGKEVAKNIVPILISLVQNPDLFYRVKHDTDLIFETKITYNNMYYIIKFDHYISVSKKSKYDKDVLDNIFVTPALFDSSKPLTQKEYEDIVDYIFFINDTESFIDFFSTMHINTLQPYYHLMEAGTKIYNDLIYIDLETIFKSGAKFSRSINLFSGHQYLHKHIIGNKETLTLVSTSKVIEEFIIYEKNLDTGDINVYRELVANLDPKVFKLYSIIVGKYKKVIEHCINTLTPKIIVRNGKIIKNVDAIIIKETDTLAIDLSCKYKINMPILFDMSNVSTVLDYLEYDNINLLYGYSLWSTDRGCWMKGKKGYYINFSRSDILRVRRLTPMRKDSSDLGYVSRTSTHCLIANVPDGIIDPDWLSLIRESYWFMYHNRDKMRVCDVSEEFLADVGYKLERLSII